MKTFIIAFSAVFLLTISQPVKGQIGQWSFTTEELPVYEYTAALPFEAVDNEGNDSLLPEDPYFLIGNYRLALFTHVSGIYQFITAERTWSRINFEEKQPNYGSNEAFVEVKEKNKIKKTSLVGINSIASNPSLTKRYFGTGFARYEYKLDDNLSCIRVLSVKPSAGINTGFPCFLISVTIKNNGNKKQEVVYGESMPVNYVSMNMQMMKREERPLKYPVTISINEKDKNALAEISVAKNTFIELPDKDQRFMYDVAPPSVFMQAIGNQSGVESTIKSEGNTLASVFKVTLKPGESKTFQIVVGILDKNNFSSVSAQVENFMQDANQNKISEGVFAHLWKTKLPDFSEEKDKVLKREMLWNAHMLEASAKYNEYYKETFIPQGSVYSYHYGDNIANRDHLQAAFAACYTNPALAKSSIRYVMKHSENDGEIKRGNSGFGYTPPTIYKESDQQIYMFDAVAEYLRITGDYGFLNEQVELYPAEEGNKIKVMDLLKRYFIYLRDEIGTGQTGLIKLLNSDWADSFLHHHSPNILTWSAESHMNTTMALAILPRLTEELKKSGSEDVKEFLDAMEVYRTKIEKVFMKNLSNRKFSARAYLNTKYRFGLDVVCIEPQGYLLQMPNISNERKKEMYGYMKPRISTPEKIGIRNREKPLWNGKPQGEDGGIWYSLEYPFLLGVATFDKEEAKSLLYKFSFDNYAKNFPQYWIGQWTAPDEINSSLYREGLYAFWISIDNFRHGLQGYCSHPHAWPLYCYYKLKE